MVNNDIGAMKQSNIKQLKVIMESVVGSVYAQIVSVVVTDSEITLEFAYINPRPGTEEAHVVSRVTLPRLAGENVAKAITNTIAEHEKKRGGKNG